MQVRMGGSVDDDRKAISLVKRDEAAYKRKLAVLSLFSLSQSKTQNPLFALAKKWQMGCVEMKWCT